MAFAWLGRIVPVTLSVLTLVALPLTQEARSQTYPTKTITVVVPFGSGGSIDVLARHYAQAMSKELGQSVIVENRAGAAGNIGAAVVARAAPDGYTLLYSSTAPLSTNTLIYKSMPFDPQKDFAPYMLAGKVPIIIAVKKGGKFSDMKSMVDYAKANPGKINLGVPGNGTLGHLVALLLQRNLGITFNLLFYNSSGTLITDILGGHIDMSLDTAAAYVPLVNDGQISVLAHTYSKRFTALPNVPTVADAAALPGFEATGWYGLLAPAGTSADIIKRLTTTANAYLSTPETQEFYRKIGVEPIGGTPEEFKAFMASETEKIRPIVKEAGLEQK
jgi:tripartite-type tricarboxylate transporter receptor subunit TctC